ncbi:MAG: putative aminohydrolase SsnA [Chloroflexi bacterium]|nr:putative aminohydrolase SsnA [Chloroflexota bacterium]
MPSQLLGNATVLTMGAQRQVLPSAAILIEDGVIVQVGGSAALRRSHPQTEFVDLHGATVMPGLICAHTHFYGAFARGMALPGEPPANFSQILERLWWRLDRLLTLRQVQSSAEVMLCDAIRNGCTTIVDHHASSADIDGSLDVIAEATLKAGVRACLAYEVSDRDGKDVAREGIAENARFIKQVKRKPDSLLAASFGLHAGFTLSDKTLDRAAAKADVAGFHVHVAEDTVDSGSVGKLHQHGILGPKTVAAHCVHVSKKERALLTQTGTNVVHNIRSNMNNAVGLPPDAPGAGLGNDGFSMNMLQEMKFAYLAPKLQARDPRVMDAALVATMAFDNNAAIVKRLWEPFGVDLKVGAIEPGCAADLVVLDYWPPTPITTANWPWHLVFAVDGGHVRSTMVAGKWLMLDRELKTLDEEEIAADARDQAARLWKLAIGSSRAPRNEPSQTSPAATRKRRVSPAKASS